MNKSCGDIARPVALDNFRKPVLHRDDIAGPDRSHVAVGQGIVELRIWEWKLDRSGTVERVKARTSPRKIPGTFTDVTHRPRTS